MLPVPRKVAQRYKEPEELTMMDWFNFDLASAAALEHWYALEPASCASGTSAPLLSGGAAACCHCAVNSWPPLPYLMRRQPPTTGDPALEATYAGCRLHCQRRHWATIRAAWYRSLAEPKTSAEPKTVLAESDQRTAAGCLLNKTRESQRKLRVIGWAFARVYS